MAAVVTKDKMMQMAKFKPSQFKKIQVKYPARIYKAKGALGVIGFISAISRHFCESCNRLRLTADGKLRQCLYSNNFIDLKEPLRQGASEEFIQELFGKAIQVKPKRHEISDPNKNIICSMASIGG